MQTIDGEKVIFSIKVYKEIEDSEVVKNVIGNVAVGLLGGVGGDIVTDFNLILTDKHLCIEAIGYSAWGRLPETRYIEKILFKDIEQVESRHVNSEDIINIKLKGKKEKVFKRKNKLHDSLVDDEMKILKSYLMS